MVRAIASAPGEAVSQIYDTLLTVIASARRSVQITHANFVPDPQLLQAREAAVARGVDVRLILPHTDSWLGFHAGRSHNQRRLEGGVKIHERRGVLLHAKTSLIDGVWATLDSTDLDWR